MGSRLEHLEQGLEAFAGLCEPASRLVSDQLREDLIRAGVVLNRGRFGFVVLAPFDLVEGSEDQQR